MFGKRAKKFKFLAENSLSSIGFKTLPNVAPMYFMVPKDFDLKKEYDLGFCLAELFAINSVGIVTAKDAVLVNDKKSDLLKNVEKFYQIKADENLVQKISYRPFDEKFIYYDLKLVERARQKLMKHFLAGENWGLVFTRFQFRKENPYAFCFLTQNLIDINSLQSPGTINIAPLYIYQTQNQQNTNIDDLFFAPKAKPQRVPNFKAEIIQEFAAKLGLNFLSDHDLATATKLQQPLTPTLSRKGRESFSEFDITSSSSSSNFRESFSEFDIASSSSSSNFRGSFSEFDITSSSSSSNFRGSFSEFDIAPSPLAGEGWGEGSSNSQNHRHYPPYIKTFARDLRKNSTDAEIKFWSKIRNNQLGHKFRRQFAINAKYIADFVCLEKRLIIELDGGQHCESQKDFVRTLYLKDQNFRVMRFWNNEILQNSEGCLEAIILELDCLENKKQFSPLDVLDYIYAVLHSPNYRQKYQEFLKIDFPRVPYAQSQNSFWQLVKLGGELRKIHLLEGEIFEKLITKYSQVGNNKIEKISYEFGKVKINQTQYFEGVEPNVWEFFIGGYQPAQKWLKDRKDKILGFEEILHYQKIIVALSQTIRLMAQIDEILKI